MENKISANEIKKTEAADLVMLQNYLELLWNFLPIPICDINGNWIILNVGKKFLDFFGYSRAEIIGESIEKLFFKKEDFEKFKKGLSKKGEIFKKEFIVLKKNKEKIPVFIFASPRKEKGIIISYFITFLDLREVREKEQKLKEKIKELEESGVALMNILEDIKEAQDKAEEEKEKTLAIITNFADGLLVFDKEKKISLINPRAEKFFGLKPEDLINKTILELETFTPLKPLIELLGIEIKKLFRKELPIKENLILEVSTIPMAKEGENLGTLVILHDITREKRIEKMKSEFVSVAAHQLRTPLSAIKWTLKMLLEGDLGKITPQQRDFIEKTYASNERMITLINDLLNVSRIEEGRYVYKTSLTNLETLCQTVIKSYEDIIKRKKIKFEFKKPKKPLPLMLVDGEKIKLVIQNLLDNAVHYTPDGGHVTISLKESKKEIEFSIRDTGVGIPEDQKERIFTKFFRAANVVRMQTEGSGLGLFICKNIVEAHGGRVWFESKEGKGTTFHFTIPKTQFHNPS